MLRRAGLVDHIDCLVGQFAIVDVARGQFNGGFDGVGGIFYVVVLFKIRFQPFRIFTLSSTEGSATSIF